MYQDNVYGKMAVYSSLKMKFWSQAEEQARAYFKNQDTLDEPLKKIREKQVEDLCLARKHVLEQDEFAISNYKL